LPDFFSDIFGHVGNIADNDLGAFRGELQRDAATYPLTRASDDGYFTFELQPSHLNTCFKRIRYMSVYNGIDRAKRAISD
jgi:hypothetical protein